MTTATGCKYVYVKEYLQYCTCSKCTLHGSNNNGVAVFKGKLLKRPSNSSNFTEPEESVAVKRFNSPKNAQKKIYDGIVKEVENLMSVQHANILRYIDVNDDEPYAMV